MFVADPDHFRIGPVTFHNRMTFKAIADPLAAKHNRQAAEQGWPPYIDRVLDYYGRFSWVADVTVKGCDDEISAERAVQAVNAAVDFLHLLFGHYHSRRMIVGGPGLDADISGTLRIRDGKTLVTHSVGVISAVGFEEGWAEMLEELESRTLVTSAGRAIEPLTDPAIVRPLGQRFVDAASWHGQAVRETSPAAAIVKAVSALERLVTVKKAASATKTTQMVCDRSAALSYDPGADEDFARIRKRMDSIYDLRSRLVHGTLSPFDPEVRRSRIEVLEAVEHALLNGLVLFNQDGLLDKPLTQNELDGGMTSLVKWARGWDARKQRERDVQTPE